MSREFSLVLLGAGMLTTGYFLWPEQDLDAKANEQAEKRVGGGTSRGHTFLWIHAGGYGSTSPRMGSYTGSAGGVSRSGFGGTAARVGGGSMG